MKIVLLAPLNSIHVVRWANSLIDHFDEVHIISMHECTHNLSPKVIIHNLPHKAPIGYILNIFAVRRFIRKIRPNIIHVHQVSGHGTLASLSNLKNHIISVYGADIYDFPKKNYFFKKIIIMNLAKAKYIASTSKIMANETKKYTKKDVFVTPFGVDINRFFNTKGTNLNKDEITIGTIKTLKKKYGIEYLIKAIAILRDLLEKNNLKKRITVDIYGKGEEKENLVSLTKQLGIEKIINFKGFINHQDVPKKINELDIFCVPSVLNSESFGVSAVEAMACEKPIIVSDVDGLKEVVINETTGYIVPRKNEDAIAEKLFFLINNPNKAIELGRNARVHVVDLYNWNDNVLNMLNIYKRISENEN